MNQRENLLALLRKEKFEYVPVEFMLCPSLIEVYKREEGRPDVDYQDYFQMPWRRVGDLLPDDGDTSRFFQYFQGRRNERVSIDEWGIGHEASPTAMHMTKMLYPLEKAECVQDILDYPMPSYSEKNNQDLTDKVQALHNRGLASVGNMQCTIWETAWYIRGMQNLMMDMVCEEEMAEAMLDSVYEMSLQRALLYAKAGVDILFLGDDIGMQSSIMMSKELYAKWIKPRLKSMIAEVKRLRPDILVFYHSCGYILPFIDDLIETGIDVLNPVQPECMDFKEIYEKYKDRLAFHGTLGTQKLMPFGTPEEVEETVKRNLKTADQGGLFIAPTHLLEPEVPWENIKAYVKACREFQV